jgi:hypothetical protein
MCRKIQCDGESWKFFGFEDELNKASKSVERYGRWTCTIALSYERGHRPRETVVEGVTGHGAWRACWRTPNHENTHHEALQLWVCASRRRRLLWEATTKGSVGHERMTVMGEAVSPLREWSDKNKGRRWKRKKMTNRSHMLSISSHLPTSFNQTRITNDLSLSTKREAGTISSLKVLCINIALNHPSQRNHSIIYILEPNTP